MSGNKQTTHSSPAQASTRVIIATVVNSRMPESDSDREFMGAEENRQNETLTLSTKDSLQSSCHRRDAG